MKRSILLHIKENQFLKTCSSLMQRLTKVLFSITIAILPNVTKSQSLCDSMSITYSVANPTCNGSANGTIDITATGGTAPYNYNWNTGASIQDLSGLSAFVYSVVVTDQNGCMDTAVVSLTEPPILNDVLQQQNILCNGGNTGYIITNVSGGTSPYNYFWSNGTQSANAVNLTAGMYFVTVVDYHGCSVKDTAVILQPAAISLQLVSPEPVPGYNVSTWLGNDGSVDLTVNGGVSPYTYVWSNAAATQDISGLTANVYSVVVTDSNHCTASASISLDQPLLVQMPSGFTPNNDGENDSFVVHGTEEYPDNLLTIFNRWGNVVYEHRSYSNQWNGFNNKGEELPDGTYFAIMEIRSKEMVLKGYVELKRH